MSIQALAVVGSYAISIRPSVSGKSTRSDQAKTAEDALQGRDGRILWPARNTMLLNNGRPAGRGASCVLGSALRYTRTPLGWTRYV